MREIIIDCAGIESSRALHEVIAREMDFPAWYGCNLDALHDLLTGLSEETALKLLNFGALPQFARGFRRVLEDAQRENPNFRVTLL